ncbi:hypothetical protein Tco_0862645 [Tanacetum coccineum]
MFQGDRQNKRIGWTRTKLLMKIYEQPVSRLSLSTWILCFKQMTVKADDSESDVDEAPIAQTMLHNQITIQDAFCDHHGRTTIWHDDYIKDNAAPVVQNNASMVPNDAYVMIDNDVHKSDVLSFLFIQPRNTVFELTEREQKIDEQLRIVICDRNIKEENLKKELHSIKLQLASTIQHNKLMVDEVTSLKKDFNQKENKYLEEFLDLKALKDKVEDKLIKTSQSIQTFHPMCKPSVFIMMK